MGERGIREDLSGFSKLLPPPVRRAEYSDWTAWLMAIMSEIAYVHFEVDERILWELLGQGGFEPRGTLFDRDTDTQGFVAVHSGLGVVVVSFRGTQRVKDWMTNLRAKKVGVHGANSDGGRISGQVHDGFNKAFMSVRGQVEACLRDTGELPVYVTGHSLGGALATLATWHMQHMQGGRLVACYTFGAPRVGDGGFRDHCHVPVYRIVNGADPVPFVPTRYQGYRHYGSQCYLPIGSEGPDETYPKPRNGYGISDMGRLRQYLRQLGQRCIPRQRGVDVDQYHSIALYRAKLREYAIRREQRYRDLAPWKRVFYRLVRMFRFRIK